MKVFLNVYFRDLKDKLNRKIVVDDDISLDYLCEGIMASFLESQFKVYILSDDKYSYSLVGCYFRNKKERDVRDYTLKDLEYKKNKEFELVYDLDDYTIIQFEIEDIREDVSYPNKFEVIGGKGYGILENYRNSKLYRLLNLKKDRIDKCCNKKQKEYLLKVFDLDEVNLKVQECFQNKIEQTIPKSYVLNVELEGFNKEIKRKIVINNSITVDTLCRIVVAAFRGDFSHLYGLKLGKKWLGEEYNDLPISYFSLKKQDKFYVVYDYGDDWNFKVKVSKELEGINKIEVIEGQGYGIVDDCGGVHGLAQIFTGKGYVISELGFEKENINDFNLKKCNNDIKKYVDL